MCPVYRRRPIVAGRRLSGEEAALEYRDAQRTLRGREPGGESGQRASGAAGHGGDVGVAAQLVAECRTPLYGKGVAAALRYQEDVASAGPAELGVQPGEEFRVGRRR